MAMLASLALAQDRPTGQDGYGNPYPADEVFARIARHEQPSPILYEDDAVTVFPDYAPISPGHMLVIARKSRARSLLDMPPDTLARMMAVARRVMIAQRDALGATGAMILISNGSVQSVPHLHIHVIPAYRGTPLKLDGEHPRVPIEELARVTAKLATAMSRQTAP